jgi:hypothetical protein
MEEMKNQLLAISGQLLGAVMELWRERWNALIGFGVAALLYVFVEIWEAIS